VEVHLGADTEVSSSCEILITNYHRLASDYDRIRHWVGAGLTHVVLDEAHRIKRGEDGVHGRAVIDLSFAAVRRDVLTGTPAPQGGADSFSLSWTGSADTSKPRICRTIRTGS